MLTLNEQVKLAEKLARKYHDGQVDKAGKPYIEHVLYVASFQKTPLTKTLALLHDIVEDTELTLSDLSDLGFSEDVVRGVDALTKGSNETYQNYIWRVSKCTPAVYVKYYDLLHNSQLSRLPVVDERALSLQKRYVKAIELLKTLRPDIFGISEHEVTIPR